MSRKTFNLVVGVTGGVASIASAVITFVQPAFAPAIVGCVGIVETAIVECCSLFLKEEDKE